MWIIMAIDRNGDEAFWDGVSWSNSPDAAKVCVDPEDEAIDAYEAYPEDMDQPDITLGLAELELAKE